MSNIFSEFERTTQLLVQKFEPQLKKSDFEEVLLF